MPSIPVDAATSAETAGGGPVIAGVQFKRASSRSVTWEAVRNTVTLADGEERVYDVGLRRVVALQWARMSDGEVETLRALLATPFTTYADDSEDDDSTGLYGNDGLQAEAIPRTVPIMHSVSVTLRAQAPTR